MLIYKIIINTNFFKYQDQITNKRLLISTNANEQNI